MSEQTQAARRAEGGMADRILFWIVAAILALAMTMGGSSTGRELPIIGLQLLALAGLPVLAWRLVGFGWSRSALAGVLLLAAMLLVPLLQLVPLPAGLWTALPLRDLAADTLGLAGAPVGGRPLSLTPGATFAAFLWLLPAAFVLLATATLEAAARTRLFLLVLILLLASLLVGGLQASALFGNALTFTPGGEAGRLPLGFFANRNHQAIALATGLPLAAALFAVRAGPRQRWPLARALYVGLTVLLIVGAVATRSRAGLVLSILALLGSLLLLEVLRRSEGAGGRAPRWIPLVIAALLVPALMIAAGVVVARFGGMAELDARFDFWPIVLRVATEAQPLGTGLGSFQTVYNSVEPAASVSENFVNQAHNDYLQLWLEAGMVFPLILLGFLAWLAVRTRAWWRSQGQGAALGRAAGIGVLILLLHSAVDYPLRTQALACLFALLCGCLMAPSGRVGRRGR